MKITFSRIVIELYYIREGLKTSVSNSKQRTPSTRPKHLGFFRKFDFFSPKHVITDVTLADEDTNWILTDNDKKAFQGNVATYMKKSGDTRDYVPANFLDFPPNFREA